MSRAATAGGHWLTYALGGLAALIIITGGVFLGRDYWRAGTSAQYCTASCHTAHPAEKQARAHREIACQSCHTVDSTTRFGLALASLVGSRSAAPTHAGSDPKPCSACHEQNLEKWQPVISAEGHRSHKGLDKVDCLSCHGQSIHGTEKVLNTCNRCHEGASLHKNTPEAESCLSCHSFNNDLEKGNKPTLESCAHCHDKTAHSATQNVDLQPVTSEHHHGGASCKLCHNPHRNTKVSLEAQRGCRDCHRIEPGGALEQPIPEHNQCTECHSPHALHQKPSLACASCHAKQAHSILLASVERDTSKENGERGRRKKGRKGKAKKSAAMPPVANADWEHSKCQSCHQPHRFKPTPNGCSDCHSKQDELISSESPSEHGHCRDCHEPHEPPPTSATCLECHKTQQKGLGGSHTPGCASCHNPHAAKQDASQSCPGCHTSQEKQVAKGGPKGHAAKKGCANCHDPHGGQSTTQRCQSCHAKQATLARSAPPKHQCAGCHTQHTFRVHDVRTTCANCHSALAKAPGTHKGVCNQCHTPHGAPGVSTAQCRQCHQSADPSPARGGHKECNGCHTSHAGASAAWGQCTSCHKRHAQVATQWPAGSAHAGGCQNCHKTGHKPRPPKSCGSCHGAQAKEANGGKHQCSQCHSPHASPKSGSGWWQACSNCHAGQVAQVRGRGATHSQCKNCHGDHRFKVPSCSSCHQGVRKQGLHSVGKHQVCSNCHSSHAKTTVGRKPCLSCHRDKTNHQPGADRCQSCHLFR